MLIWLTVADGWMRYWVLDTGRLFSSVSPGQTVSLVLAEERVWQIQMGVLSLLTARPAGPAVTSAGQTQGAQPVSLVHQGGRQEVVVRVQARQHRVERGERGVARVPEGGGGRGRGVIWWWSGRVRSCPVIIIIL